MLGRPQVAQVAHVMEVDVVAPRVGETHRAARAALEARWTVRA